MAHFYADIQGNRGEATRMGTPTSGISGHIRGWRSGASVQCYVDENGKDVVDVCATKGSGYGGKAVNGLILCTINGKINFLTTKKRLLENR